MLGPGTPWHSTAVGVTICGALTAAVAIVPASIAFACSLAPAPLVSDGFLGVSFATTGFSEDDPLTVPRNFAAVGRRGSLPTRTDGTPLVYEIADAELGIQRVVPAVEAGTLLDDASGLAAGVVVDDVIDTEPPSAPTVTGGAFQASGSDDGAFSCAHDSCGRIATLSVDIDPATDDHTPDDRITYALFRGATEAEATSATVPMALLVRDGSGAIWRFADSEDEASDIWVTVAAIDLAGNVGPRSAPMQIHAGASDGCNVASRPMAQSALLFGVVLAFLFARRRRR